MADRQLGTRRSASVAGWLMAIAVLLLSGCAPKPPYQDQPYTPTGKVRFDSMEPRGSAAAEPVVQQPTNEASPTLAVNAAEEASRASESDEDEKVNSEKTKCAEEQSSVLTLKTESYDITICETDNSFRYHGSYLPTNTDTERPALTSGNGYYVKEGSYEYWITSSSIAIYEGKDLILEEPAQ